MGQKLTDAQVKSWATTGNVKKNGAATPVRTLSEQLGERGAGSMLLERRSSGVIEVYLSRRANGRQERSKLGVFAEVGPDGQTRGLAFWRREVEQLAAEVRVHGSLASFNAAQQAKKENQAQQARIAAQKGSLEQLLRAYVEDMKRRNKTSADNVLSAFELDVIEAFPHLASRKARDIEPADISEVLRHCINRAPASKGRGKRKTVASVTNGKLTTANRLRSYLRAAFSFGLKHDLNPLRAGDAVLFGLRDNPVAYLPTIEGAERANTEALTKEELRQLLIAIQELPERNRAMANAMLYLGGQRVKMLLRATWQDVTEDTEYGAVLGLVDRKGGKGSPPRDHLLPISDRLSEILEPFLSRKEISRSDGIFSLDDLQSMNANTAQKIFSALGKSLSEKQLTRYFTWRTVRATIETHLAALGVDEQRRAWLLSHGRSGVQAKHYDRYNYLREKQEDLEKWAIYLDELILNDKKI
ncbi:TPA: tyrosine-type recombinase/integrase [Pseudomonas aeruginosa]